MRSAAATNCFFVRGSIVALLIIDRFDLCRVTHQRTRHATQAAVQHICDCFCLAAATVNLAHELSAQHTDFINDQESGAGKVRLQMSQTLI